MNRTWKSVFSVLLAVALLLPMAPVVRAERNVSGEAVKIVGNDYTTSDDVTVRSVELNPKSSTIYFHDGYNDTVTVTATVLPTGYNGSIEWKLEPDNGTVVIASSYNYVFADNDGKAISTATLKAGSKEGTVSVSAVAGNASSNEISITVKKDEVSSTTGATLTIASKEIQAGKTTKVSVTGVAPQYAHSKKPAPITYESSDPSVATVDASGTVTGKKVGTATISAEAVGIPLGNTVSVTVSPTSLALTGNATLNEKFPLDEIYSKLRDQFIVSYGVSPTSTAQIFFPSLGSVGGTLYTGSGDNKVEASKSSDGTQAKSYRFSDMGKMYLMPTSEGTFSCEVKVVDGDKTYDGKISITISVPNVTVRIPIDGSSSYTFARPSADSSGKTGVQLMREKIGAFGSIEFGTVSAGGNVGTLYTSSPASNTNRIGVSSTPVIVASNVIDELYFTPSRAGTYTIPFTAYTGSKGTGLVVCTGSLILPVDGNSLDLTINLSSLTPYTFNEKPSSSVSSLYAQFLEAIDNAVGGSTNWGGIRFDGAAKASSTGTLHQSSSSRYEISADDYIIKSGISKLYYVPERSGTYEITYGIYASESDKNSIATGTLTIKTSTIPAGASDITYTTPVKGSITLDESDFIDFYQEETGSSKSQLSYVVFEEYDGEGTFYHAKSSFLPYKSADYYASTYSGTLPTNPRYLDSLTFTAPSTAGYTAVLFTCYGTTSSNKEVKVEGKLCIYYTADNVPVVSYDASGLSSLSLKESDFVAAYNTAMKSSVSRPTFHIQLLDTPGKGTLYYYYSTSSRKLLSSSNIDSYTFSVNDSSGASVDEISYEPNRNATGTDEITYLATSSSGAILYIGTIQFKLSSDLSLNITNDGGSNFQLNNFYSASDSDPVLYVTFPQPSSGKVYVYADGRYTAVSANTKLYTISSVDGQYPLTSAFYAPKANEAGTVSLKYITHRKSGMTNNNTITINVLSKISSGTFGDVSGVFNWAANSIDFANKMGLVNGTQLNPPLFSPADTMRRSDFVLMLYRLAGSPAVSGSLPYTDVPAGKYYYNSAVWAYQNNIMRNVTANALYNPEGALTRQDFAQILFNYTVAMGGNTANNASILSYSDASSVSANTLEGVTWAVANGYITSAVAGALYIEPTRSATRAEISTLLHRYLTY